MTKSPNETIAASPEQLLDMAEYLVDARLDIAGIHHQTESLAGELADVDASRLAGAAESVKKALAALAGIDGAGVPTLAHTRGAVFQAEAACRHTREQLLQANRPSPTTFPKGPGPGIRVTGPAPKPAHPTTPHPSPHPPSGIPTGPGPGIRVTGPAPKPAHPKPHPPSGIPKGPGPGIRVTH